jgi:metal-responsive CopG/Arc/MetJ family transcriptional regulator
MNVKVTFTIPEDIVQKLKDMVAQSKRSAFAADALSKKLQEVEREQLEQQLIRDYTETREEDRLLNAEWEPITLENWPDYEWDEEPVNDPTR